MRCLVVGNAFGGGDGDGFRRLSIASAEERRRAGRRSEGGGGGGFTPLFDGCTVDPLVGGSPSEVDARTVGLKAAVKRRGRRFEFSKGF